MIFGFCAAIIAGFLLTAVQTWTGVPAIKGTKLAVLFFIWLLGRIVLLFPGNIPMVIVSVIDLSFLPLVAIALAYPIIQVKQWKNLLFTPILLLLFFENIINHYGIWVNRLDISRDGVWSAVLTVTLLVSIMGGRVIPFFTANATGNAKPAPLLWLELFANIPLLFLIGYFLMGRPFAEPKMLLISITMFAALFQLIRTIRWNTKVCFQEPLLWSLHLSYLFLPLGMLLLSLHFAGYNVSASQALHSITVGAIGGVILAMISRVSLGHTGRKLQALPGMKFAFSIMLLAGLIRSPLSAFDLLSPTISLTLSFLFFIIAYCIFLLRYFSVLTKSRLDGRPG